MSNEKIEALAQKTAENEGYHPNHTQDYVQGFVKGYNLAATSPKERVEEGKGEAEGLLGLLYTEDMCSVKGIELIKAYFETPSKK